MLSTSLPLVGPASPPARATGKGIPTAVLTWPAPNRRAVLTSYLAPPVLAFGSCPCAAPTPSSPDAQGLSRVELPPHQACCWCLSGAGPLGVNEGSGRPSLPGVWLLPMGPTVEITVCKRL